MRVKFLNKKIKFLWIYCILLMTSYAIVAQNSKTNPFQIEYPKSEWDLRVNGFKIKSNLDLTLSQNLYNTSELTLIEVPVLLKYNITEKLSLLGGAKFDFMQNNFNGVQDLGISTSLGLQYDFNDDAYIQAVFDFQLKPTNNTYHYNYGSPSSFSIRSGFKF